MHAVVDFADWSAGDDRAVVGAEAARHARSRSAHADTYPVREKDRVIGVIVAGAVRGGRRDVASLNLVH